MDEKPDNSAIEEKPDNSALYFFLFILSLMAVMFALALLPLWVAASIATSLIAIAAYRFVWVTQGLGNQEPHGRHPQ